MPLDPTPRYDEPISPAAANGFVQSYLNNENFKPADFTAFYFHVDELQRVIDESKKNDGGPYIKFTLGMKYILDEKNKIPNNVLYGCVMMTVPNSKPTALGDGEDDIYDYSHPVPPYTP